MNSNADKLVNDLESFVNTYNIQERAQEFIKAFCMMHRTNQQSTFKLILQLIEFIASENYRTDARNEATKIIAQELLTGFKNENKVAKMYDSPQMKLPSNHIPMI